MGMFQDETPAGDGLDEACEKGVDDDHGGPGGPELLPALEDKDAAGTVAASSSAAPAGASSRAAGLNDTIALLREFLLACLQPSMFVSLPIVEGDGTIVRYICQILRLQPKVTTVKLFSDDLCEKGLLEVAVQPLQRWSPVVGDDPASIGSSIEVYVLEEPTRLDILKHLEQSFQSRSKMLQWRSEPSCMSGCLSLVDPVQLAPPAAWTLDHPKMPTLCLLDALRKAGFKPANQLVEHSSSASKVFDGRKRVSRGNYFRCVVASEGLFAAGVPSFKSNQSNAFYAYLMRFKKLPDPKQTAAQLQKLINAADTDEPPLADLVVLPSLPAPSNPNFAWVDEDDELLPLPGPGPAVPAAAEVPDAVAAIESASIAALEDDSVPEWPAYLDGARLTVEAENLDPTHHYFARLKVRCNNPEHLNCGKSRSTNMQCEVFGSKAALYYLGAWLAKSNMPESDHKKCRPTVADIRSYIAASGS